LTICRFSSVGRASVL